MSNSEARKGQSLEQSLSETLEPVSHCASDCVTCHFNHRLLYDQIHVLCGSLVFMEPRIDSCAKSIQTDRHHPQYPLLWVGTDRQTPIQLKYRLGTRQTWSRAIFSHPTHQIDRSYVGLAFQLPCYSDWLRHYVGRRGSFMFSPTSVLVAFIIDCLCCLSI